MKVPNVVLKEGDIIAFNKPLGISSNFALTKLKRIVGIKKMGHAGTLDPLASGVLIVGFGRAATKRLWTDEFAQKEYVADIDFSAISTTGDNEGEKTTVPSIAAPTEEQFLAVLHSFVGTYEQMPPVYSALKIAGKPAYERARSGESLELTPRPATIISIALELYEWPRARIRVVTGSGVYIRALARDIGEKLGAGGYLTGLTRTRVGAYTLADAYSFEELQNHAA